MARNPLIVDIFYLAGLIEEYGSGIQKIIDSFNNANLPEPEFKEEAGGFFTIFRKDNLNKESLSSMGLNERQIKAINYLKENESINNTIYREINTTTRESAKRDLEDLCSKGIISKFGEKRKVHYKLNK